MLRSSFYSGFSLPSTLHAPLSISSYTTVTDVVSFVVLHMVLPLSTYRCKKGLSPNSH